MSSVREHSYHINYKTSEPAAQSSPVGSCTASSICNHLSNLQRPVQFNVQCRLLSQLSYESAAAES